MLTVCGGEELSVEFLAEELKSKGKQNTAHIRFIPIRKRKLDINTSHKKAKSSNIDMDPLIDDLLSPENNPISPKLPPSRMQDITNKSMPALSTDNSQSPQITRKPAVVMGPAMKQSNQLNGNNNHNEVSNSMPNLVLRMKLQKMNQGKEGPKPLPAAEDNKVLSPSSLSRELKPDSTPIAMESQPKPQTKDEVKKANTDGQPRADIKLGATQTQPKTDVRLSTEHKNSAPQSPIVERSRMTDTKPIDKQSAPQSPLIQRARKLERNDSVSSIVSSASSVLRFSPENLELFNSSSNSNSLTDLNNLAASSKRVIFVLMRKFLSFGLTIQINPVQLQSNGG